MGTNRNLLILKLYIKPILISLFLGLSYFGFQIFKSLVVRVDFSKVPFVLVLDFIYYNLGWLVSIIIPLMFLFSTIYVFGQLSYDSIYEEFKYERHKFSYFVVLIGIPTLILSLILYYHNDHILSEYNFRTKNISLQLQRLSQLQSVEVVPEIDSSPLRSEREMDINTLKQKLNYLHVKKEKEKGRKKVYYDYLDKEIIQVKNEIQKRYAFSFSPLFFVLLALSIGYLLQNKKSTPLLFIGLVVIVFYWFGILLVDKISNKINPFLIWLPNVAYLFIGIILFFKASSKFNKHLTVK